jgi:hypothetical protein
MRYIVEKVCVTGYGSHTEYWIRDTEKDKRLCMCKWINDAEYVCDLLNSIKV